MILRDQHNARRFYLQNWSGRGGRADVSALCDTNGRPIERIKYSAYGTPITLTDIDYNSDGSIDPDDTGDFVNTPYDWNLDGSTNGSDTTAFQAAYNAVSGNAWGRGYASLAGHGNRIGYAGYIYDRFISGSDGGKWHVRHRVLDSGLGRWTRRDPLGYVDGMGLYEYVRTHPNRWRDAWGFCAAASCQDQSKPRWHPPYAPDQEPWEPWRPSDNPPGPGPWPAPPNPNDDGFVGPPAPPAPPSGPPNPFDAPRVPPIGPGDVPAANCPCPYGKCVECCIERRDGRAVFHDCYASAAREFADCIRAGGTTNDCKRMAQRIFDSCIHSWGITDELEWCLEGCDPA